MYAKVFSSLWQGSLGPQWEAWSVFVFLLAHADLEGFVDIHPDYIARCSGIPHDAVRRGLQILESPDPSSRSEVQDGRRIERLDVHRDWGWQIVNYQHYRNLQDKDTVRFQNRERQRRRRNASSRTVTDGHASSRHAEVDVEAEEKKKTLLSASRTREGQDSAGFKAFYRAYPRRVKPREAEKAYSAARKRHPDWDHDDFRRAAAAFGQDVSDREMRYIPHPASWLNADGFLDQLAENQHDEGNHEQARGEPANGGNDLGPASRGVLERLGLVDSDG